MTENFLYMLAPIMNGKIFLILLLGTLFGLILGVLPGLGPTTGGALILPFTMTLEPLSAIILLTSIYFAGTYGGAITAGKFLAHFADFPFIHIDLPGVYSKSKYGYRGKGATGMGVRLLYHFIKNHI